MLVGFVGLNWLVLPLFECFSYVNFFGFIVFLFCFIATAVYLLWLGLVCLGGGLGLHRLFGLFWRVGLLYLCVSSILLFSFWICFLCGLVDWFLLYLVCALYVL